MESSADESGPKHILKIPHKLSRQFSSHFASGAILGGPDARGHYHLIFYLDSVWVESETGTPRPEGGYETSLEAGDIRSFREDQARISMSGASLRDLYAVLHERFKDGN